MRVVQDIPSISQAKIKIKTCADVYNYWKTKKRHYKNAPSDGIEFTVDYVDTGLALDEQVRQNAPIVLALHGAPGSYYDYSLLIRHLFDQNIRVIVPNFPEYVATVKTKVLFRHSADEKAAYLRDFLQAIGVNKIDLLVSHSSAVFPSLIILMNGSKAAINIKQQQQAGKVAPVIVKFEQPIEIGSLALLNPAGHRLPMSMKPSWFKCGSVRFYQHKLGRSLFRKLGPSFLTVVGVPVRVDNMDNVMLSATVMRNSKCKRVMQQLKQLSEMKLPTLLVFSENDKLIEKEIFYEMSNFMNLNNKSFDIFDNEGNIELSRKYTITTHKLSHGFVRRSSLGYDRFSFV